MPPGDFLPSRGAARLLPVLVAYGRDLTPQDILDLATYGNDEPSAPPPVQVLTANHRRCAQLVAQGMSDIEVGIAVGRTPQRVAQLRRDPSFIELVAYYEVQEEEAEEARRQRMQAVTEHNSELAAAALTERLENERERAKIPTRDLLAIQMQGLDRTLLPPKVAVPGASAPLQVTFNIPGRGITQPAPQAIDIVPENSSRTPDDRPIPPSDDRPRELPSPSATDQDD